MKPRGFTLMEVMIALAIVGILSLITAQALPWMKEKSRDSVRVANMVTLQKVIELYHQDNDAYPSGPGSGAPYYFFTEDDPFSNAFSGNKAITNDYVPKIVPTYFEAVPHDPNPGAATVTGCEGFKRNWAYFSNGEHYKLVLNCASEAGLLDINDSFVDPASCLPPAVGPCSAWAVSDNMEYTTNALGWQ
jgi:prepilin-type N-terminal cleavage/methylation domain-containing protein